MLELCFYAEKWSTNPEEVRFDRWQSVCWAFGVEHCYIIDKVGFPFLLRGLQTPATVIEEFSDIPSELPRVFVEKDIPLNRSADPYTKFIHPADGLYCFGGDACGMQYAWHEDATDMDGEWIFIPSSDSPLWAEQAAAIVLADRYSRDDNR